MNRFFKKSIVLMALVGGVALSTGTAEAALTLQLTTYSAANVQLATTGVITDGGAGDAAILTNGVVGFIGPVGAWNFNIMGGVGAPIFGDQPHLDLSYSTVNNANGGIGSYIVVDFTETAAVSSGPAGFTLHIGGTNNNTITTGSLLVNGLEVASLGPFATESYSLDSTAGSASSPYTLTQRVVIVKSGLGPVNGSGDYEAKNTVPEPASLSLLALGLAGTAALRRRRQATK